MFLLNQITLKVTVDKTFGYEDKEFPYFTQNFLTLTAPIPDQEKKLTQIFIFTLLCGALKGFMKALKAFIKPFEVPQRSVKTKI